MQALQFDPRPPTRRSTSARQIFIGNEVTVTADRSEAPRSRPRSSQTLPGGGLRTRAKSSHSVLQSTPITAYQARLRENEYLREGDNVRELAEFLRTRPPPATNYMSYPDEPRLRSRSKSPFGIFGRRREPPERKPLKLPDSAVAAKTIEGFWHIAISIPSEYEYFQQVPQAPPVPKVVSSGYTNGRSANASNIAALPSRPDPRSRNQSYNGPITVPKPFAEKRLSSRSDFFDAKSIIDRVFRDNDEGLEETARPSTGMGVLRRDLQSTASHPTVNGYIEQHQSRNNDQRHSGGTVYSQRTVDSQRSNSDEVSSVSTAPSKGVPLKAVQPPIRVSSHRTAFNTISTKLELPTVNHHRNQLSVTSTQSVADSFASGVTDVNLATADSGKTYGPGDIASTTHRKSSSIATTLGPTPVRELSLVLEEERLSSYNSRVVTQELPAVTVQAANPIKSSQEVGTIEATSTGLSRVSSSASRGSRKERVKALRARDMAAHKESTANAHRKSISSIETVKASKSQSRTMTPQQAKQQAVKKRRNSPAPIRENDLTLRKKANTMSAIMLVADMKPSTILQEIQEPSQPLVRNLPAENSVAHENAAPPLALSDDDDTAQQVVACEPVSARKRSIRDIRQDMVHNSSSGSTTATASVTGAEFSSRLSNIEQTNMMMLQTLSAVLQLGKGLGEIGSALDQRLLLMNNGVASMSTDVVSTSVSTSEKKSVSIKSPPRSIVSQSSATQMRKREVRERELEAQHQREQDLQRLLDARPALQQQMQQTQQQIRPATSSSAVPRSKGLYDIEPLMRELRGACRISLEGSFVDAGNLSLKTVEQGGV